MYQFVSLFYITIELKPATVYTKVKNQSKFCHRKSYTASVAVTLIMVNDFIVYTLYHNKQSVETSQLYAGSGLSYIHTI